VLAQLSDIEYSRLFGEVGHLSRPKRRDQWLCRRQFTKPLQMTQVGRQMLERRAGRLPLNTFKPGDGLPRGNHHQVVERLTVRGLQELHDRGR
jgi:hypothetical protein